MKNNIIPFTGIQTPRYRAQKLRQDMDQDLFVDLLAQHPAHIARSRAKAAFNGHAAFYCNYLTITNVSRVKIKAFAGPNGGCAVKDVAEKTDKRRMSPSVHEARLRLYNDGMTDGQIADVMGVQTCTIANWRSRYSLPSNYRKKGKKE